jgi:hypothetical protein
MLKADSEKDFGYFRVSECKVIFGGFTADMSIDLNHLGFNWLN